MRLLTVALSCALLPVEGFSPSFPTSRQTCHGTTLSAQYFEGEWKRTGVSIVSGALISAGVWLAPEFSVAATPTPVEPVPETQVKGGKNRQASAEPAKVSSTPEVKKGAKKEPVPSEKLAVDKARAVLNDSTMKLKTAQSRVAAAKAESSKSTSALSRAGSTATAAKTAYIDANDKLSRISKNSKESVVVAQRIKVAETKDAWRTSQTAFEKAKATGRESAAALSRAERVVSQATAEKKKAQDTVKSAEKSYQNYKEKVAKQEKKAKEEKKKAEAKKAQQLKEAKAREARAQQEKKKAEAKAAQRAKEKAQKLKEAELKKLKQQQQRENELKRLQDERNRKAAAERAKQRERVQNEIRQLESQKKAAERAKTDSERSAAGKEAQLKANLKTLQELKQ